MGTNSSSSRNSSNTSSRDDWEGGTWGEKVLIHDERGILRYLDLEYYVNGGSYNYLRSNSIFSKKKRAKKSSDED